MKATQLFAPTLDGFKDAGIWFCGQCRIVYGDKNSNPHETPQAAAEACCRPSICQDCGKEAPQYHNRCMECFDKRQIATTLAKIEAAEKVETWDGWVYDHTGAGDQDGYFESMDALVEHYEDNPDQAPPELVFLTNRQKFALDFSSCVESALSEMHEDARDQLDGEDEMTALVDAWAAKQTVESYQVDESRAIKVPAIVIPPEETEAPAGSPEPDASRT